MTETNGQHPGQDGPFRHLIERAMNVRDDDMTTLYCISVNGNGHDNLIFSNRAKAEEYAKVLGVEVREKVVPTARVNLGDER